MEEERKLTGSGGLRRQRRDRVVVGVGSSTVGDVAAAGGRSGSCCRQQNLGQATTSPSSVSPVGIQAGLPRREPPSRRPNCPGRRATGQPVEIHGSGGRRAPSSMGWSSRRRAPGRRCGTEGRRRGGAPVTPCRTRSGGRRRSDRGRVEEARRCGGRRGVRRWGKAEDVPADWCG
jgi:hypothetical protein